MNVWYVSYGSNICKDRFSCYIHGGIPQGSDTRERGCTDKTDPKKSEKVALSYPLYFAKEQSKWGTGGVAFIGLDPVETERTLGRKYLITEEQFSEVVAQENNLPGLEMDLKRVMSTGSQSLTNGWYGTIIYLGKRDGFPMFTFKANNPMDQEVFTKPAATYLSTIAKGLHGLGLNQKEIIDYLLDKRGIKGHFTVDSLAT